MVNFLLRFKYLVAGAAILLAVVVFALALRLPSSDVQRESLDTGGKKSVEVKSVRELSLDSASKSIIGTVQSLNEADLRAERSGSITRVYARAGDYVKAGTAVASISNAGEAAGVLSARAEVESAKAGVAQAGAALSKVLGGARPEQLAILRSTTVGAESALSEATVSARNALTSAYAVSEGAVVRSADKMITGADGADPRLSFESTNYSYKIRAGNQRIALQSIINRQQGATTWLGTLTSITEVTNELTRTENELQQIKLFLDTLLITLDGAIPTQLTPQGTIDAYRASAGSARAAVIGSLSSLSGSRVGLSSANAAYKIAKENESLGIVGAQKEDVETAEAALALARAGLSRARAGVAGAAAVYEKTLIRTPISGVLTTFSLQAGDFVNMYQSVGTVANEGALEVLAYVSAREAQTLSRGDSVVVEKKYTGTITNVAPGINPQFRQVEVRIALDTGGTELVHGESVAVEIIRNFSVDAVQDTTNIKIPVAAVKFEVDRIIVFSVTDRGTLVASVVELGEINGDLVEVKRGLTMDMQIVTDARGLYEEQNVSVK